jgi:hypothetical protein
MPSKVVKRRTVIMVVGAAALRTRRKKFSLSAKNA